MSDNIKPGVDFLDKGMASIYEYLLHQMTLMQDWLDQQREINDNFHADSIEIELALTYEGEPSVVIGALDGIVQVYRR